MKNFLQKFFYEQAKRKKERKGKKKIYKRKRERRVKKKSLYNINGCFLDKKGHFLENYF